MNNDHSDSNARLRELYPSLTDEDLATAGENLRRFSALLARIAARVDAEAVIHTSVDRTDQ